MSIPNFLQPYLASYDLTKLDMNSPSVAVEVITSVLNLGDTKAVSWLFGNYTHSQIRDVVRNPKRGVWNEESLNYWKEILKINTVSNYNSAILNINPQ